MAELAFHSMPDSAYLWTAMHVADEETVALQYRLSLRFWNWSKGNLWEDHRYET